MNNLLGEFIGTIVLIVFGCGVCANLTLTKSKGVGGGWICVTAGWGFAVLLGVYTSVALGAPQADLNPSVTLAKTLAGVYTVSQCLATSLVQIAGGIVGAAIVWLAYLPHWAETEDKAAKLGIFCTAPAIRNTAANFLCEANLRLMAIGQSDGHRFALQLTQPEMGEICGVTSIHVNRMLRELRQSGICTWQGYRVEVHDIARLVSIGAFSPEYLYYDAALVERFCALADEVH